jgi:hypothetical protein
MTDDPTLGAQRRRGIRILPGRLWLWTAASLLVLAAPAWADERPHAIVIPVVPLTVAPASDSISVAALFGEHAVGQGELAAQRGGTSFAVPIAQTNPQTPQIILWDELKAATPAPAGSSQGTNRINIQIR